MRSCEAVFVHIEEQLRDQGGQKPPIWPPFGPGVTWGPNSRPRSSLWGAQTAGTAGSARRAGAPPWPGVSVERTAVPAQ